MSQYRRYSPVPESLPWRLCKYFEQHPDALLSRQDIARLFSVFVPHGIQGNIAQALGKEAIREVRERGKEIRWGKGPSDNVVLRDPVPGDVAGEDEETAEQHPRANNPFSIPVRLNILSIPILKQVPLGTVAQRQEIEFQRWLSQFEVGDSAEFPLDRIDHFRKPVQKYSEARGARFVLKQIDINLAGLERVG